MVRKDALIKGRANFVAGILRYDGLDVRVEDIPHLNPNYAVWQIAYDTSARIDACETMQYFPDRIADENRTQ